MLLCNSRKYLNLSNRRDFFENPPPLWKLQLSFMHFFKFFWPYRTPHFPGNSIPSVGGVFIFSGTAHCQWYGTFCGDHWLPYCYGGTNTPGSQEFIPNFSFKQFDVVQPKNHSRHCLYRVPSDFPSKFQLVITSFSACLFDQQPALSNNFKYCFLFLTGCYKRQRRSHFLPWWRWWHLKAEWGEAESCVHWYRRYAL